jgi:anti-sigma B factor antagonist
MQLSVARNRDVNVVRVQESRLTYPVLATFYAEVRQIVEEGAHRMVIDLEAVIYIDSAAVGCLIDIHNLLERRDGTLRLSGLQPRVETMLLMVGVQKVMHLDRKEADALAAFGLPPRPNGEFATHTA